MHTAPESAERVRELARKLDGLPPALAAGLLGTDRSALAEALGQLRRRYGTIDAYLAAAGLSADDLALRSRLTSIEG